MITILVVAVIIGIAVAVGHNLPNRPPPVAVAIARMDRARRAPHRHVDHDDPAFDAVAERRRVAIHEAGHIVSTEDAGMGWREARIYNGGGGIVHVDWATNRGDDFTQVVNAVAIYRAGEYAEGSGAGAGPDRANAKRVLNGLPRRVRGRALTKGERQARSAIAGHAGRMRRYAVDLNKKGRLR